MAKKFTCVNLLSLILLFISSAFSQEATTACVVPTPSFTTVKTCAGKSFELKNTSTNTDATTTFSWDFNNDAIADRTTVDAVYTFDKAGSYPVNLTVTNALGCGASITSIVEVFDSPIATMGQYQNVFIGYEPYQSSLLKGLATGGTGAYSYSWTGSSSTASSIEVKPTATTTYYFNVKDVNGCTATTSATVKVIDVRCGPKLDKVSMCGPKGTSCVNKAQVPGYLNKGWMLGNCNIALPISASNDVTQAGSEVAASTFEDEIMEEKKNVKVLANPTAGVFKVQLENFTGKTEIEIFNSNGNPVEKRIINAGSSSLQTFNLTNKASGIYLVKVVGDNEIKMARVLVSH